MPATKTKAEAPASKRPSRAPTVAERVRALPKNGKRGERDLRKLPYGLKQAIREAGGDDVLNMDNLRRMMALNIAQRVVNLSTALPLEKLGDFVSLVGVEHIPNLEYLMHSRSGREALAQAFRETLDTPAKLKAFEQASFALQADAYSNCDQDHPLCAMWNAGGLHMALYGGLPYNDAAVRRAWGLQGGRRRTRRCKGRSKRRTRHGKRKGRRCTRRRP